MTCCKTHPNSVGMPALEPEKVIVECGTWVGSCGMGIHEFFLYLGRINSKVTVWFERKYTDDILNAYQFGEILGATPTGGKEGSFSFEYAPYDPTAAGADEIKVEIINNHRDSEWRFRVDCPEEYEDDPPIAEVKETESECGRYHHQAGYAKKNTILLGDEPGNVNVTWAIQGYAEVKFYQGDVLLKTIKSNRTGVFSFDYDPTKGPVYALTQGTGTVDYLFSCPYTPPEEIPEKFEFTCGDDIHVFQAPKVVNVILPDDQTGSVEIWFETESTVVLKFMQRDTLLYQVQQFEGSSAFSFDYDPANGPLTIISENYGQFRVSVKCPYNAPPLIPDPPKSYDLDCWDELQTFEAPSEITVRLPNVTGSVLVTYVIPGATELSFNQAGLEIGHGYPEDGLRSFSFNYQPSKGDMLIVATGSDDFQLWVDCPIPPPPPEYEATCGIDTQVDSPSVVNLSLGDLSGNFYLTADKTIALYNHSTLVASFTGTRPFFYTVGDQWKVVSSEVGVLNLKATCPSIKGMVCGPDYATFLAGDTVLIDVDENVGDTHPVVVAPDTVTIAWYVDGALAKTTTGSAEFDLYLPEIVEVRLVSSGTGTFDLLFPCPIPRKLSESCGIFVHEGEGIQSNETIHITQSGPIVISTELVAPRSLTFTTDHEVLVVDTAGINQFIYNYDEAEGPVTVSFTGSGAYKYVISCPPEAGGDLTIPPVEDTLAGVDPEDPEEEIIDCTDSYNTELELVSDLTLPVPSAGSDCPLILRSRAYKQDSIAPDVYGASLITMVRKVPDNRFPKKKLGADFFFYYEFPLALDADDFIFVLKGAEADTDVAMYVNCFPVLDRARNLTLRETVTLFDPQTFVQIYWRYPDDITSQANMTGGVYAAIVRKSNGEIMWRSGDQMPKIRTNVDLVCKDDPRWPISRTPKSENIVCASPQTKDGVFEGQTFVTATWETILWSDGVIEDTEKVYDGVCKLPPTVVSQRTVDVTRQCPSGQTVSGIWQGTATQKGSYVERTLSDGKKINGATVWEAFCAVPQKPVITIVSQVDKVRVTPCPAGQTKGGYIGGDSFITGSYIEYTWSDGSKTQSEVVYPEGEVCQVPYRPYVPPSVVSTETIAVEKACPAGQTVNGVPGGRAVLTGTQLIKHWSDGTTTSDPVVWEAGSSCQLIRKTPEEINPTVGGPVYAGAGGKRNPATTVVGRVVIPTDPTPFGSLNPVNAAMYSGQRDQYGANRIVFSPDKNVKPAAKDYYVSVPIGLPMSAIAMKGDGGDLFAKTYRIEVMSSGVSVSAPTLIREQKMVSSVKNGNCYGMAITSFMTKMNNVQPDRSSLNLGTGAVAYDFSVWTKNSQPVAIEVTGGSHCPVNKAIYTWEYDSDSIMFKVDARAAGSGLAGFSFVVLNSATGAVMYRSGQDGAIRVTS